MRACGIFLLGLVAVTGAIAATVGGRDVAALSPSPPIVEGAASAPAGGIIPGRLVVRFKPGTALADMARAHSAAGAQILKVQPRSGLQRLQLPAGANADAVLAAYQRNPQVESAAFAHKATLFAPPNDANYPYQWHMHNTTGGIHAEDAWTVSNAGQGVVVAVIDSGVAYENFTGPGGLNEQTFTQAPDLSDVDFVAPWDFFNNDAHANDDHGHGSHVAGTIAQDTNDAYGVAGVAHNATIMPLKVLAFDGTGNDDDVAEAIRYAVDHGARVLNMSFGFTGTGAPDGSGNYCTEIAGLNDAIEYAHARNVVMVAAAGNDGGQVSCPAAHPRVIAVGAGRFDGQITYYSNRGATLDVSAPGGDDTADQNGDGFYDGVLQETFCYDYITLLFLGTYDAFCDVFYVGTSMASPHVTGVAALLLGMDPALTPNQVRAHIESTARDRGAAGWDPLYGWGAVDAHAAVLSLTGGPPPAATPTSSPTASATGTATNTPQPTATTTPPLEATATPTATSTPTATATPTVTPTNTAAPTFTPSASSMHVGDLDGTTSGKNDWSARVTVYVHTNAHGLLSGATVTGVWSGSASGTVSCVTDRKGKCTIQSSRVPPNSTVNFTVTGVTRTGWSYDAAGNHDPDGGSNGTTVSVSR